MVDVQPIGLFFLVSIISYSIVCEKYVKFLSGHAGADLSVTMFSSA